MGQKFFKSCSEYANVMMYRALFLAQTVGNSVKRQNALAFSAQQKSKNGFLVSQLKRLSNHERQLLRETFKMFEKNLIRNGVNIFLGIFSENPEYKRIWPQFRAIPDSSLISSIILRKFAQTYMNGLKEIIESLDDERLLGERIQRIAIKHVKHNIHMCHIQKMLEPVLKNVRTALGRRDENTEQAWTTLFQIIGTLIEHSKAVNVKFHCHSSGL